MTEEDQCNCFFGYRSSDCKRIKLSTDSNQQEGDVISSDSTSILGLTLRKTPSFLNLVEMKLSQARSKNSSIKSHLAIPRGIFQQKMDDFEAQSTSEKLKASIFPVLLLRIGSWERFCRHKGDLVAKCYYAKKKIIWEVLDGTLKSKIEIQWSDIEAIRATIVDDQPGILEIELNQAPQFFRETNPQPRKHSLWHPTSDFTGGQALAYKRYYVRFPPGTLDKNYEKLLECDHRLFELSQRPFPQLESPYFYSNIYSFMAPSSSLLVPPEQLQSLGQTIGMVDLYSSMSDMDYPQTSDYSFEDPKATTCWGAEGNNSENLYAKGEHRQRLPVPYHTSSTQDNIAFSYHVPPCCEEVVMPDSDTRILNNIKNHLLGDSLDSCFDESKTLAWVRSLCSLVEPQDLSTFSQNIVENHIPYEQETYLHDREIHEHLDMDACVIPYVQPIMGFPPQVNDENSTMSHLATENFQHGFPDLLLDDYHGVDTNHEYWYWQ